MHTLLNLFKKNKKEEVTEKTKSIKIKTEKDDKKDKEKSIKPTKPSGKETQGSLALLLNNLKADHEKGALGPPEIPTVDVGWEEGFKYNKKMYFCTHKDCPFLTQGEGTLCKYHLFYYRNEENNRDRDNLSIKKQNDKEKTIDDMGDIVLFDTQFENIKGCVNEHNTKGRKYKKDFYVSKHINDELWTSRQNFEKKLAFPVCIEDHSKDVSSDQIHIFKNQQTNTWCDTNHDYDDFKFDDNNGRWVPKDNGYKYARSVSVWKTRYAKLVNSRDIRSPGKGGASRPGNGGGSIPTGRGRGEHNDHDKGDKAKEDRGEPLDNLTRQKLETLLHASNSHWIYRNYYYKTEFFSIDDAILKKLPPKGVYDALEYNHLELNFQLTQNVIAGLYCRNLAFKCLVYLAAGFDNNDNDDVMLALQNKLVGRDFGFARNRKRRYGDNDIKHAVKRTYSLVTLSNTPVGFLGYYFRRRAKLFSINTQEQSFELLISYQRLKQRLYQAKKMIEKPGTDLTDVQRESCSSMHAFCQQLLNESDYPENDAPDADKTNDANKTPDAGKKSIGYELRNSNTANDFKSIMIKINELDSEMQLTPQIKAIHMFAYWTKKMEKSAFMPAEVSTFKQMENVPKELFPRRNHSYRSFLDKINHMNPKSNSEAGEEPEIITTAGLETATCLLDTFIECFTYILIQFYQKDPKNTMTNFDDLWDNDTNSKARFLNTLSHVQTCFHEKNIKLELPITNWEYVRWQIFKDKYFQMFELTDTYWISSVDFLNLFDASEKNRTQLERYTDFYMKEAKPHMSNELRAAHAQFIKHKYITNKYTENFKALQWNEVLNKKIWFLENSKDVWFWGHKNWGTKIKKACNDANWSLMKIDNDGFALLHHGQRIESVVYNRATLVGQFIHGILHGTMGLEQDEEQSVKAENEQQSEGEFNEDQQEEDGQHSVEEEAGQQSEEEEAGQHGVEEEAGQQSEEEEAGQQSEEEEAGQHGVEEEAGQQSEEEEAGQQSEEEFNEEYDELRPEVQAVRISKLNGLHPSNKENMLKFQHQKLNK